MTAPTAEDSRALLEPHQAPWSHTLVNHLRAALDREAQGQRDYCDLMDRHDAHFVAWQAAKARAEKAEAERDAARAEADELDFLRHEGGPQSVAAMEVALKAAIPVMRRTAAEYLESVMIRHDAASIARSEWSEIAGDLDAICQAEACMGRQEDDASWWLDAILDAGVWRKHVEPGA